MVEKLGQKRGKYASAKPITVDYNIIEGYRVLKKPESPQLIKIKKERNKYNRVIRKNKKLILDNVKIKERKEVERWINSQTYGTKLKGEKVEKPNIKNIDINSLIWLKYTLWLFMYVYLNFCFFEYRIASDIILSL